MGHLITFKARTYVTGQAERQSTLTIYPVIGEPAPECHSDWTGEGARPHTSTVQVKGGGQECPPHTSFYQE
jgi:hypothetical protein